MKQRPCTGPSGSTTHLWNDRTCSYCGDPADSLDHVVPRSRGGRDLDNRVPCCVRCQRDKGGASPEQWAAALLTAADPRTDRVWLIVHGRHPNRMDYLPTTT